MVPVGSRASVIRRNPNNAPKTAYTTQISTQNCVEIDAQNCDQSGSEHYAQNCDQNYTQICDQNCTQTCTQTYTQNCTQTYTQKCSQNCTQKCSQNCTKSSALTCVQNCASENNFDYTMGPSGVLVSDVSEVYYETCGAPQTEDQRKKGNKNKYSLFFPL